MENANSCELAIVGGGPAGMSAAVLAAGMGIDTVIFDDQHSPGGQVYRAIAETPVQDRNILGTDYWEGIELVNAFRASKVRYVSCANVWSISRSLQIAFSVGGKTEIVRAKQVILATGALERPFPIAGWTLPGVMTVGAAQILLKASGMIPEGNVVLAGTGPLIWLFAAQYLRSGRRLRAIIDTTPFVNWLAALPHVSEFFVSEYRKKAFELLLEVRQHVPVYRNVTEIKISGREKVETVEFHQTAGSVKTLGVDYVLLHQGVAPNINLAISIGCEHKWETRQLCFHPIVDEWGNSSIDGIAIAGDGAGIKGAAAAKFSGILAALNSAYRLGQIDISARDKMAESSRCELCRATRGRKFIDALHRPSRKFRIPTGDVIVCRCEEVTASQIADTVALGCPGPNQVKALVRCGMGSCQGRYCGLTVTEMIAHQRNLDPSDVGYYRLRPPIKPILLGELAKLPTTESGLKAVERD